MALTVGELVGYIRLDDTGWNNRLEAAETGFGKLGSTIKAGTVAMAASFTAVTAATVGLGVAAFNVGANYNILQQSSRAALATLLGGAEAANVQMDKLDAFARTSPFAKQVFITAQQQLLGFGVQAERVIPILDAVQNAVAAVGGNNEQVGQVTYALAQMQGQGKLTGETLNQLGQYGIDAAGILGEKMGETGAVIRDLASKPGGIPVSEIWDPLVEGLMERFGGATAAIKEQFVGATDRIKGAWRDIGSILATPFIDPHGGGMAVVWANQVADALRALEQKARPLVDLLLLRFKPGLDAIGPALERVKSGVNALDLSKVNGGLDTLVKYAPLVAGVTSALIAIGGPALLGPLGAFLPAINPVVAGIAALVAFTPGMRDVGAVFADSMRPLAPIAKDLGTTLLDTVMAVLSELVPALGAAAEAAGPLTMALANALVPAVVAVAESMVPIAGVVADVVTWFSQLPVPVLATVTALVALQAVGAVGLLSSMVGVAQRLGTQMGAAAIGTRLAAVAAGELRLAMSGIGGLARTAGANLLAAFGGPVGLAIMGISAAFGIFINQQQEAKQRIDDLRSSLDETTAEVTGMTREVVANNLAGTAGWWVFKERFSAQDAAKVLGVELHTLTDAAMGNVAAMELVNGVLESNAGNMDGQRAAAEAAGLTLAEYGEAQTTVRNAVKGNSENLAEAIDLQKDHIAAVAGGKDAIDGATEATVVWTAALSENTTAAFENSGGVLSAKEAVLRYQEAVASTTTKIWENLQAIAQNDAALKSGTLSAEEAAVATAAIEKAQRSNEEATLSLTRAGLAQIDANAKNNASGEELRAQMAALRTEVVNTRLSMGETTEQAEAYADALGLIPANVVTTIEAKDLASGVLNTVVQQLKDFEGKTYTAVAKVNAVGTTTSVSFPGSGLTMKENGGIVTPYADGGIAGDGRSVDRVSQIAAGGRNILWAEPSTVWEAYISGKPDQRNRNLNVLDEAARRLGRITLPAGTKQYASGNVTPAPAVTAPAARDSSVDLSDRSVQRLADAILAGAARVSVGLADARDRAAAGTRQTVGRTR